MVNCDACQCYVAAHAGGDAAGARAGAQRVPALYAEIGAPGERGRVCHWALHQLCGVAHSRAWHACHPDCGGGLAAPTKLGSAPLPPAQ